MALAALDDIEGLIRQAQQTIVASLPHGGSNDQEGTRSLEKGDRLLSSLLTSYEPGFLFTQKYIPGIALPVDIHSAPPEREESAGSDTIELGETVGHASKIRNFLCGCEELIFKERKRISILFQRYGN